MNTMKFYRVVKGELLTLRIGITQQCDFRGRFHGKTRADACKLARSGGFVKSRREAERAA